MKLIDFPEKNTDIAKNQPQYLVMPAYRDDDIEGTIICCWKLSFKERIKLLFSGILWHRILSFHNPVQPQHLGLDYPFIKK